jgi:hypothetical protein
LPYSLAVTRSNADVGRVVPAFEKYSEKNVPTENQAQKQ